MSFIQAYKEGNLIDMEEHGFRVSATEWTSSSSKRHGSILQAVPGIQTVSVVTRRAKKTELRRIGGGKGEGGHTYDSD